MANKNRRGHADSTSPLNHRRLDIQGLRAIAVFFVVAFHVGLPLPGGFLGVDIFFVVSGYVITGMLAREWAKKGNIDFANFYAKRVKRLAPALSVMVAVVTVAAALTLSPLGPQQVTALTGVAALLGFANFAIARVSGAYFAPSAEQNPLLNTWSLSVEEQIYLFLPLILAAAWSLSANHKRYRAAPSVLLLAFAGFSFSLALLSNSGFDFAGSELTIGYYSPLPRIWEFAVGALIALGKRGKSVPVSSKLAAWLSALGASLIILSAFFLDTTYQYPALLTTLPVLGTAVLLVAGTQPNVVAKILSSRPMVRLGDWSYSLYLWHWPFVVFAVQHWPSNDFAPVFAGLASVVPAVLSFYLIEQPVRNKKFPSKYAFSQFFALVAGLAVLVSVGVGLVAAFYWQPKVSSGNLRVQYAGDLYSDYWSEVKGIRGIDHRDCDGAEIYSKVANGYSSLPCARSTQRGDARVVVLGDSHAAHLFLGLVQEYPQGQVSYYALASQAPVDDGKTMSQLIDYVANHPGVEKVILTARWPFYDGLTEPQILATLEKLTDGGKNVLLTDGVPTFSFGPENCKYERVLLWNVQCEEQKSIDSDGHQEVAELLRAVSERVDGVTFAETFDYFCEGNVCGMEDGAALLWGDSDHLNAQGSQFLSRRLVADYPYFFD